MSDILLATCVLLISSFLPGGLTAYYGIRLGSLRTYDHGASGDVYVADDRTLVVNNFKYDGRGPDAYFWVGRKAIPDSSGSIALHADKVEILMKSDGKTMVVKLPVDYKMSEVKSLSVWCRQFKVNFADISFDGIQIPASQKIDRFPPTSAHDVRSSEIVIMDSKTIKVPSFRYDGQAPDAYFLVGKGQPSSTGTKVPIKGQKEKILQKTYRGEDVILELPGDLTVADIAYLSVYCIKFKENFGSVLMPGPGEITVPARLQASRTDMTNEEACLTIKDKMMNVYWKKMENDQLMITLQGKLNVEQYMAFGISGSDDAASMINGDVVVTYANRDGRVITDDYFLKTKSACSSSSGVCRDGNFGGRNDIEVVSSQYVDGILTVTYKRSMTTADDNDRPFNKNGETSVIAAIGPVDSVGQVKFHDTFYNKGTIKVDFKGIPSTKCQSLVETGVKTTKYTPWPPSKISGETNFRVALGPTGGERGYKAITGIQSWGIAFYVNGLLIPEITVVRGVQYTFTIESGDDASNEARFHPLYITTDPHGGVGDRAIAKKTGIVAGVKKVGGQYIPTAGRWCKYQSKENQEDAWKTANTFQEFTKSLEKKCEAGSSKSFTWTPDNSVPDLVYYQCWIHENLGWKIHVTDNSSFMAKSSMFLIIASLIINFLRS